MLSIAHNKASLKKKTTATPLYSITTSTIPGVPKYTNQQQMPQLTDDQQAVYDRQLRVWGVEVQKRYAKQCALRLGPIATHLT